MGPDPNAIYPNENIKQVVYIKNVVANPNIIVGEYTYYDDAYYMTKCTPFPAVLVECGFISNETEAKNMLDDEWKNKMAQGIAQGIMAFLHI